MMVHKTARQKIQLLFWIITGFGTLGMFFTIAVLFILDYLKPTIVAFGVVFTLAYMIQVLSAIGLVFRWFTHWVIRPGNIIKINQWMSGIISVFVVLDFARRFLGKTALEIPQWLALSVDGVTIALLLLWFCISHFINEDVKERKVCEFC